MTFSVFIVLNFAYSVSVSLPFNMIHLTLSHSNFVLKILFFSSIVYKAIEMLQLWAYNEWSSSNLFHMESGPVCTFSTQHSLIQLKPERLRLLQPTRSLEKNVFKRKKFPCHITDTLLKTQIKGSKARGKHNEIELRFSLQKTELYILVVYLGVLELCEEFLNLLWLNWNVYSDLVWVFVCERELVILARLKFLPYILNAQRLVVMTSGGEVPKDQRSGRTRIISEKPKCCNTRNSWVTSVGTPDGDPSMKRFFGFSCAWNTMGTILLWCICFLPHWN